MDAKRSLHIDRRLTALFEFTFDERKIEPVIER